MYPQNVDRNVLRADRIAVRQRGSLVTRLCFLALALFTGVVVAGHFRGYAARNFIPEDFGAFYCSGKVVLHRQDPYRVEPLLDCERQLAATQPRQAGMANDGVNPAPLPAYDFIPLAALAALPVKVAVMIFGLLLLGATAAIAYCLARMSALPTVAAFAIAFIGITYGASGIGQLAPFAIAGVAGAALFLRLGKQRAAALVAAVALIQPQFGVPVLVSTFLFVPRARLIIGMAAAALTLCGTVAIGPHAMLEYLSVLSIHARSELNSPNQYSFTWLAHAFGASATTALMVGAVSYVVFFAICMLLLARGKERTIKTGAAVLLPAAFSVFGGTFIHDYQISVALLAAIVLVQPTSIALAPMVGAALLTVPFGSTQYATLAALPALLLTIIAAWCVVFFPLRTSGTPVAAKYAFLSTILIIGLISLLLAARPVHSAQRFGGINLVHHANALASSEYQRMNDAAAQRDRTPLFYYLLLKLPLWCGLAMTLWFSSANLLSKRDYPRSLRGSAHAAEAAS